ncbi:MAG: hypothetical protein PVF45_06300 [Anaerolineae bacterium]|jgi:hypothetical protein
MRRTWLICLTLICLLSLGAPAAAQSPFVGQIISPQPGGELRGSVQIVGVATHPDFAKYDIYALTGRAEDEWIPIATAVEQNVGSPAQLAVWDTTQVPDDQYILLLRVWKQDGGLQDFQFAPYNVVNSRPVEPPTPEATPTPEVVLPTVPPQTPTVLIEQPPTATDRPTATPGGPPTSTPTTEPSALSALNTSGWRDSFCSGAWLVAALFALWGIVWIIRQGVRWLLKYQRKRGLLPPWS